MKSVQRHANKAAEFLAFSRLFHYNCINVQFSATEGDCVKITVSAIGSHRNQDEAVQLSNRETYLYWVRQFILFNDKKHPEVMGNHEIERFLNHLAVNRGVSPATQNQALCAIIFLYKNVLKREIENLHYKISKTPRRMPTVLNPEEVASILRNMEAEYWLITALLYGCGLRISEALSLRIKDIDLKSRNLLAFNGKGRKDRYTFIPGNLRENMEW